MPKLFSRAVVLRDRTFRFRVTDGEQKLIKQLAHDCGMNASDYCRRQALAKRTRSKLAATIINELSELNAELKHQQNKIGCEDIYESILFRIAEAIERIPADAQMEDF